VLLWDVTEVQFDLAEDSIFGCEHLFVRLGEWAGMGMGVGVDAWRIPGVHPRTQARRLRLEA